MTETAAFHQVVCDDQTTFLRLQF